MRRPPFPSRTSMRTLSYRTRTGVLHSIGPPGDREARDGPVHDSRAAAHGNLASEGEAVGILEIGGDRAGGQDRRAVGDDDLLVVGADDGEDLVLVDQNRLAARDPPPEPLRPVARALGVELANAVAGRPFPTRS